MTAATTGWFLVRWLVVAYAIESLMITWLPVGAVGEGLEPAPDRSPSRSQSGSV